MNFKNMLSLVGLLGSTAASASDTLMCWVHRTTESERDFQVVYTDIVKAGKVGKVSLPLNVRTNEPFNAFALFSRQVEKSKEYIGLRLYVTPNALDPANFLKTFGSKPHDIAPVADTDETLKNLPYAESPSKTVHLEFRFAGVHQAVACRVCRIETSCPSEETHREMAKATKSRFHGQIKFKP